MIRRRPECLLLILGFIVNMRGTLPLLEPEESRYAEIPRQMLESGTFIVPLLDGQSYLDKPPLFYWLVMLSYSIFGDSVWSARIVPSLIAALIVPVVYRWARHLGERPRD
jgi:4-amino-4-deoxy-L-arabinose transferase-like glycosyltransferase